MITDFTHRIKALGPLGSGEGLNRQNLTVKLKAAKMALEGKRLRMVFARQARYIKHEGAYREIPADHALHADMDRTLADEMANHELALHLEDRPRPVQEVAGLLGLPSEEVVERFKRLEKKGRVAPDRLIVAP